MNRHTGKFKRFNFYSQNDSLSHHIKQIYEDQSQRLWVVTNQGLHLYQPNLQSFAPIVLKDLSTSGEQILSFTQDKDGQYWILTPLNGIYEFFPQTLKLTYHPYENKTETKEYRKLIFADSHGSLWIGTDASGLTRFNKKNRRFYHYTTSGPPHGTRGSLVRGIVQWDDQRIIIGIDQGGINIFDYTDHTFKTIDLASNGVSCLHLDQEGILWAGTSRAGVLYYNSKREKFNLHSVLGNSPQNALLNNRVSSLMEDSDHKIWIGTDGNGIAIFDPIDQSFELLKDWVKKGTPLPKVIRKIEPTPSGNIWILTWNQGIFEFNPDSKTIKPIPIKHQLESTIEYKALWDFHIDHKNRIWIISPWGPIHLFTQDGLPIQSFYKDIRFKGGQYAVIYHTKDNRYILATRMGLQIFDEETQELIPYTQNSLNHTEIMDIILDSKNTLWVATYDDGLYSFDDQGDLIKHYSKKDGLLSPYMQSMEIDEQENLWIGLVNGLVKLDTKNQVFTNFNGVDGLPEQFFVQSSLKASDGTLYYGSFEGFSYFHPEKTLANTIKPPIYIQNIKVFNSNINLNTSEYIKHPSGIDEIHLDWTENMVTLEFAGINFSGASKNQYAYKLDGIDENWVYTSASKRFANYSELSPGTYLFSVKAANNSGVWNEKAAQLKIIIKPPFWKKDEFIITTTIISFILIISLIGIRERKIVESKEELKRIVDERTYEINDLNHNLEKKVEEKTTELRTTISDLNKTVQQLDRFIYSTSHELSAPLKSVLGLLNIAKNDKTMPPEEYYDWIEKSILKLDDVIQSFVTFSKNSRTEVQIKNYKVNDMIHEIINDIRYYDHITKIDLQINVPKSLTIKTDGIRLKIILTNLINNSVKYFDSKKDKNWIKIGYSSLEQGHQFIIQDNGIGIKEEQQEKIFSMFYRASNQSTGTGLGLYILQEAVTHLNGHIDVSSTYEKGTSFTVTLPIIQEQI